MFFITLAVMTVLCLAFPDHSKLRGRLRRYAPLLFSPYPTLTLLGVLLLGGIAFIYFQRRKPHAH